MRSVPVASRESFKVNVGYRALTDPHQLWLDLNEKCPLLQAVKVAKSMLTDPHQLWLDLNEKCPCRKPFENGNQE